MKRTSIFLTSFILLTMVGLSACYGQKDKERNQITSFEGAEISSYDVVDRSIKAYEDDQFKGVEMNASSGDGFAWIKGQSFTEGTIEMDIKGANNPGESFVGIAFHGEDRDTFEGIYFRPFNFRSDEAARRSHSVQYHSLPNHSWRALRTEFPDAYEAEIPVPPDPDGWFHARIKVEKAQITVYVDNIKEPVLQVESLSGRTEGKIGLWVGSNSSGRFANVKITGLH